MGIKDKKKQQEREEAIRKAATKELAKLQTTELKLAELQQQLAMNPQFTQFLALQKQLQEKTDDFWKRIKEEMIANGVKKISGEGLDFNWGWITIGETEVIEVTDESKLPRKFFKRQVDTQKLKDHVKLTKMVPEGVTKKVNYKIMKKINIKGDE